MRTGLLLSVGVLLVGLSPVMGQAPLAWKWKENETFYVVTQRQVKQKLTIDDPSGDAKKAREVNQAYEINTVLRYTVKSKDAMGKFLVEQVVESMVVKNAKGTLAPVPGVQETTLTFVVTPQGEVSEVKGYEALIKKLADQGAEREFLKATFSEQSLKDSLQEMFAILPPPMHKKGEKWTRKSDLQLGSLGKLEVTRSFNLVGEEKKDDRTMTRVTLTAQSAQNFSKDKREVRATGNLYFDAERGRLGAADLSRTTHSASRIKLDKEYGCELDQTETITIQVLDKRLE